MSEPSDMIVPMLQEMRAENARLHGETRQRLDRIEAAQRTFQQALSADSLLSKLVTGEFEQRLEALERRMSTFEGRSA